MLHEVVNLSFESVDKILKCNDSNESYWVVLSCVVLLFAEGEVNIGEYLPSRRRAKYLPIFTEPKANNCFTIIFSLEHQKV